MMFVFQLVQVCSNFNCCVLTNMLTCHLYIVIIVTVVLVLLVLVVLVLIVFVCKRSQRKRM